MNDPILTLDNQFHTYNPEHYKSAETIKRLMGEGFDYPEMFNVNPQDLIYALDNIKCIRFDPKVKGSLIIKEKDYLVIYIGRGNIDKTEMQISLVHELIHIHLQFSVGISMRSGIHFQIETEVEEMGKLFFYSNKTFCEILFSHLELFTTVEMPNVYLWESIPEFLRKYLD